MHSNVRAIPVLPASDIKRARAFYEDKLGFHALQETSEGVVYEVGDGYVYLYETSAPRGGNTALSLDVEDFDSELLELRDKGVEFDAYDLPNLKTHDGVAEMDGMKTAWFRDPEGNILALGEWKELRKHHSRAA